MRLMNALDLGPGASAVSPSAVLAVVSLNAGLGSAPALTLGTTAMRAVAFSIRSCFDFCQCRSALPHFEQSGARVLDLARVESFDPCKKAAKIVWAQGHLGGGHGELHWPG